MAADALRPQWRHGIVGMPPLQPQRRGRQGVAGRRAPTKPTVNTSGPAWRPVTVAKEQYVVSGGRDTQSHLLSTFEVQTASGASMHFTNVNKKTHWLRKLSAGKDSGVGVMKRVKVLERLRGVLEAKAVESKEATPVVAAVADNDDPMNALDDVEGDSQFQTPQKGKRPQQSSPAGRNYQKKRLSNQVCAVDMPILPPEAGAEAEAAGNRRVRIMARGLNSVYIDVTDVDWLVTHVAKEIELGGVPVVSASAGAPTSAVADSSGPKQPFNVRWDWAGGDAWIAEMTTGALKGEQVYCSITKMTATKWASVEAAMGTAFAEASYAQRKEGTRLYLEAYCTDKTREAP